MYIIIIKSNICIQKFSQMFTVILPSSCSRLPSRQWGLLHAHPLLPHHRPKPDPLRAGPERRRGGRHGVQRRLFHRTVQPESHQHHRQTQRQPGDAFTPVNRLRTQRKESQFGRYIEFLAFFYKLIYDFFNP